MGSLQDPHSLFLNVNYHNGDGAESSLNHNQFSHDDDGRKDI